MKTLLLPDFSLKELRLIDSTKYFMVTFKKFGESSLRIYVRASNRSNVLKSEHSALASELETRAQLEMRFIFMQLWWNVLAAVYLWIVQHSLSCCLQQGCHCHVQTHQKYQIVHENVPNSIKKMPNNLKETDGCFELPGWVICFHE